MTIDEQPTCEWWEKPRIDNAYFVGCMHPYIQFTFGDPTGKPCTHCGARVVVVKEPAA